MPSGTNVFLLLTDKDSLSVRQAYEKLKEGMGVAQPAYVLFHQKSEALPNVYKTADTFIFTNESLVKLGYIPLRRSLVPGSNHFPVLRFFLENPHYDHYWVVEDDVRFNGHWDMFFNFFATMNHDFISCHLRHYAEEPSWIWWNTLMHADITVPLNKRIRSFNPIYRLSNKALRFLHESLSNCWAGHHEVLIPTLLHRQGMNILDFGGAGPFVPGNLENRFYTSGTMNAGKDLTEGTMRYRPTWDAIGTEPNKLYHPFKA